MKRIVSAAALLALGVVGIAGCGDTDSDGASPDPVSASSSAAPESEESGALQLDPTHDYGNKYAAGVLPVGDGSYSTTGAAKGTLYVCSQYAQSLSNGLGGGADTAGPWFSADKKTYDLSKKVSVSGSVRWESDHSIVTADGTRVVTTNDLPDHATGTFPVDGSDEAYQYDRNPNSISEQRVQLSLPADPRYGEPQCMGGQVGVMTTGVELFNALDAVGRDAGAWEVQDGCEGHPERTGAYHYHTLSSCIGTAKTSTVIGWALDGFPITGPKVAAGNILTTDDLDECHGITSPVTIDGTSVTTYHYVMTQDFPYSVSCFRATPVTTAPMG